MLTLLISVVLIALVFEYINGFHDTANSIATVVATKVLAPMQAVALAAITNLLGALWGTAVAKTIASGLLDAGVVEVTSQVIICALLGGIIWNLVTWYMGLPSSSSHALIGGLCGAAIAAAHNQWGAVIWSQPTDPWYKSAGVFWKVVVPMISSPLLGFAAGFLVMGLLFALFWAMSRSGGFLMQIARPRWANQTDSGQNRLSPSENRWLERSQTYPGIAAAMGDQWGRWLLSRSGTGQEVGK